jgi:ankyrin repeat protein
MEKLLHHNFNIETKTSPGSIALHIAVNQRDKNLIRFLLNEGAHVNATD